MGLAYAALIHECFLNFACPPSRRPNVSIRTYDDRGYTDPSQCLLDEDARFRAVHPQARAHLEGHARRSPSLAQELQERVAPAVAASSRSLRDARWDVGGGRAECYDLGRRLIYS